MEATPPTLSVGNTMSTSGPRTPSDAGSEDAVRPVSLMPKIRNAALAIQQKAGTVADAANLTQHWAQQNREAREAAYQLMRPVAAMAQKAIHLARFAGCAADKQPILELRGDTERLRNLEGDLHSRFSFGAAKLVCSDIKRARDLLTGFSRRAVALQDAEESLAGEVVWTDEEAEYYVAKDLLAAAQVLQYATQITETVVLWAQDEGLAVNTSQTTEGETFQYAYTATQNACMGVRAVKNWVCDIMCEL